MPDSLVAFVLGPVRAERGGKPVILGGRRQVTVFARLIAATRMVVTADRLIEDVWGPHPPAAALSSLHASISRLRRALEPDRPTGHASVLRSGGGGYSLWIRTDVDELAESVGRAGDLLPDEPAAAAELLETALASWRGAPYSDLSEHGWLVPARARCHELHLAAVERVAVARLILGAPAEVTPVLTPLVEDGAPNERIAALLAVALFRQGRQAQALTVCRRTRRTLDRDHGIDPGAELRDVEAAILAQDESAFPSTIPTAVSRRLHGSTSAVGHPIRALPIAPGMIGREQEQAVIAATVSMILSGHSRTVVLTGEPGIGKTTLAQTIAADLVSQGWVVCWGRCTGSSGAPSLWPWLQLLQSLAAVRLLPASLRSLIDGETTSPADAPAARWQQQRDIQAYLRAVSESAPLLIIIEDMHWADGASVQMLSEVAESAGGARLGLMITSRSPETGEQVEMLARLARAGSVRLVLTGLGVDDVARMSTAAGLDVDATALAARTGGNPFLLRETIALAATTGQSPIAVVPATVEDVLRARVALLPAMVGRLLSLGSVLGGVVDVEVLSEIAGTAVEPTESLLDIAVRAGLLEPAGTGRLRFVHDLVRETLYSGIGPLATARLHGRALAALQSIGGSGPVELATHAAAAGPAAAAAAVTYAVAAAREAQRRLAYVSAVRWWQQAADGDPAGRQNPADQLEVLLGLTGAQLDAGDAVGALRTRSVMIRVADEVGNPQLTARALVAMDRPVVWMLRPHDRVELDLVGRLEQALQTPLDDDMLTTRLQATLAFELYDGRKDPRCDTLSALALHSARRIDDPALLAFALNVRQLAIGIPGREVERAEVADELVALGRDNKLPSVELAGHQLAQQARLLLADISAADRHAVQARRLASELALLLPALQQQLWDSSRAALEGDFVRAFDLLEQVEQTPWDWWGRDAMLAAVRVTLLLRAGRAQDIGDLLEATRHVHPRLAIDSEVLMCAAKGRTASAAQLFCSSPLDLPQDWTWLAALCVQAAAAAAADVDWAVHALYAQLLPWSGHIAASGSIDAGRVDDFLDLLVCAGAGAGHRGLNGTDSAGDPRLPGPR